MSADEAWLERPLSWSWNTAFLSVVAAMERSGGWGLVGASLCAAQDIELPLPLRDTLNAPCRGWKRGGGQQKQRPLGKRLESASVMHHLDWNPSDPLSYFSKHTGLLNIKKEGILIWVELVFEPQQQQCFIPAVKCAGRGQWPFSDLSAAWHGKKRLSLTSAVLQKAQKANGSQVIFPLRIRSSSTGSRDFLTHKPTQTAEVSMRAVQGAWGSKPTLVLWKANLLFPVHWMS